MENETAVILDKLLMEVQAYLDQYKDLNHPPTVEISNVVTKLVSIETAIKKAITASSCDGNCDPQCEDCFIDGFNGI
jgi:hypothetical protein